MLHGNPTWSFYYRDLVRELSPGVRCIAPDHVGMGLSDKPAGLRLHAGLEDRRHRGAGGAASACGGSTWSSTTGAAPSGSGFAVRRPGQVGPDRDPEHGRLSLGADPGADRALPRARPRRVHRARAERLRRAGHLDGDGRAPAHLGRAQGLPLSLRQLGGPDRRPPLRPRHPDGAGPPEPADAGGGSPAGLPALSRHTRS